MPIVDLLKALSSKYAPRVYSPPFAEVIDQINETLESGGWVRSDGLENAVERRLATYECALKAETKLGAEAVDACHAAIEDLVERNRPDKAAQCETYAHPDLPEAIGVLSLAKPYRQTTRLTLVVLLGPDAANTALRLGRDPLFYQAFPAHFSASPLQISGASCMEPGTGCRRFSRSQSWHQSSTRPRPTWASTARVGVCP